MKNLILIGTALALAIGVVVVIVLLTVKDTANREYRITIPPGTSDKIAAGEDPAIIPAEIRLTLGKQDILVIDNQDSAGHRVSDFWVGAGETIRQEFRQPGVYQGECTIHKSAQVQIIVTES